MTLERSKIVKRILLHKYFWGLFVLSGFLLAGTTPKNHIMHKFTANKSVIKKDTIADSLKNVIQGQVFDAKSKKPLIGVSFLINKNPAGITRVDGRFKLTVPDSLLHNKIVLSIMYIGSKEVNDTIMGTALPVNIEYWLYPSSDSLRNTIICAIGRAEWFYLAYNQKQK